MLIGSLVELHVGLHLCLCFSHLEKTAFKSSLDTSSTPCCLSSFFNFFLSQSWQLLDTWWIDRAFVLISVGLFLDTSSIPSTVNDHFLDTFLDRCLDTTWHLHLSRFIEGLFKLPCAIQPSFLSISLSIDLCFLSQTISSQSNLCSSRFLQAFSSFS